ncbi:YqgE/AlgH family protein [Symbiopectobacterium purcellii]|uniref:YqgE/AlgH family protein n=1 Tax=Symbiopectobacterium purcellii TaxID=2871826 RepID=UPI003F8285E5
MNLQHHFLITMPAVQDPVFKCALIYIFEHNEDGAMGLIVNKPMDQFSVEDILSKLHIEPTPRDPDIRLDKPVFSGGPLADDRGFILHTPQSGFGSSISISSDVMVTTSKDVLENVWLTAPAEADILFHTPIAERWRMAAKRIGIDIHNIVADAGHA